MSITVASRKPLRCMDTLYSWLGCGFVYVAFAGKFERVWSISKGYSWSNSTTFACTIWAVGWVKKSPVDSIRDSVETCSWTTTERIHISITTGKVSVAPWRYVCAIFFVYPSLHSLVQFVFYFQEIHVCWRFTHFPDSCLWPDWTQLWENRLRILDTTMPWCNITCHRPLDVIKKVACENWNITCV